VVAEEPQAGGGGISLNTRGGEGEDNSPPFLAIAAKVLSSSAQSEIFVREWEKLTERKAEKYDAVNKNRSQGRRISQGKPRPRSK